MRETTTAGRRRRLAVVVKEIVPGEAWEGRLAAERGVDLRLLAEWSAFVLLGYLERADLGVQHLGELGFATWLSMSASDHAANGNERPR